MFVWIRWPWLALGFVGALTASVFQNCGQSFRVADAAELRGLTPFVSGTGENLIDVFGLSKNLLADDASLKTGTFDDNCMTSSTYEACIFWKNPSATNYIRNGEFIPDNDDADTVGVSAYGQLQQFGINVSSRLTAGQLRNSTFDVHYRTGTSTKNYFAPGAAGYKISAAASASASTASQRFGLEQIQTFFVLDTFREFIASRGGGLFIEGLAIPVNAVNLDVESNAYYAPSSGTVRGGSIELGVRKGKSSRQYQFGLSSEVTVHEMAHANLDAANLTLREGLPDLIIMVPCSKSGKEYYVTSSMAADANYESFLSKIESTCGQVDESEAEYVTICKSSAGCLRAIDEGQADFFAMTYFARAPSVGELSIEKDYVRYWRKRSKVTRANVDTVFGVSYYDDFLKSRQTTSGEIHDMGEVISEILFDIYANDAVDRSAFLKTVTESLTRLNQNSTFLTMRDQLISIDASAQAGKNASYIRKAFSDRGY
ncbi:MAG: M36 family metallopeptidase [Bdellovibrionaceae bacterium]|nr:M36 family metallopeptidase [Pseudobdellovibrionaceae bacterium]